MRLILSIILLMLITSCVPVSRAKTNTETPKKTELITDCDSLLDVKIPAELPNQVKEYNGFRLSFNKNNSTPNWVAWELSSDEISGDNPRGKRFWKDSDIDGCPSSSDYKNSGYDRGHMAPAADMKWHPDAMYDCFSMTNICPQNHFLNSGLWKTLEEMSREWAERDKNIIIVSGPIYQSGDRSRIGYEGVRIPSAFFKVLLYQDKDNPRTIGFVLPNTRASGNIKNYVLTVDEIENITGFDFFYALPESIENDIESKTSFTEWNR